jgi:hypothetical protein
LLIDQLEELFTLELVDDEAREGFIALLSALAGSGLVWVLATMRSDFYHHCGALPALAELAREQGQYHLLPPERVEIGQMIRLPARAAGLVFEADRDSGIDLADLIEDAAARDPAALPLLEFTLHELYERRGEGRLLTFESYNALGGLEGALAQYAEETFADLTPAVQEALPAVLTALVTVDPREPRPAAAKRVPRATVASTPERETLLDAFVGARLIIADQADDIQVVRVAHEALLEHWPRLQAWLRENREFLQSRARIEEATERWDQEGRDSDYLFGEGKPLAEAEDLLTRHRPDLSDRVIEFIQASVTKGRRKQRRLRMVAIASTALSIVAILGAYLGITGQWRAEKQANRARANFLAVSGKQVFEEHPLLGLRLALEGLALLPENDADDAKRIVETIRDMAKEGRLSKLGSAVGIKKDSFVPDGAVFVLWSGGRPELRHSADGSLVSLTGQPRGLTFSPDPAATYFVVSYSDGPSELRRTADRSLVTTLADVAEVTFSADQAASYFVTRYRNARGELRRSVDGSLITTLSEKLSYAKFSPDPDATYVVISYRGAPKELRRTVDGSPLSLKGEIQDVKFSESPELTTTNFVVIYRDAPGELHRGADGSLVSTLAGNVTSAQFSPDPDSSYFVVRYTGASGELRRSADGSVVSQLGSGLSDVKFSSDPNTSYFVVIYRDAPAELRRSADGSLIVQLEGNISISFSWGGVQSGSGGNVSVCQLPARAA